MVEWFRALVLKSGDPFFKSSTLLQSVFVLGSPPLRCVNSQLVSIIFAIFGYLFTVSLITTIVRSTFDTQKKLLIIYLFLFIYLFIYLFVYLFVYLFFTAQVKIKVCEGL